MLGNLQCRKQDSAFSSRQRLEEVFSLVKQVTDYGRPIDTYAPCHQINSCLLFDASGIHSRWLQGSRDTMPGISLGVREWREPQDPTDCLGQCNSSNGRPWHHSVSRSSQNSKHRSVSNFFDNYDSDWVYLAMEISKHGLKKGCWGRELKTWTAHKILLLSPELKVQSRTLCRLLSSWSHLSPILRLTRGDLPGSFSLLQLYHLQTRLEDREASELRNLMIWTGTRNIRCARDLIEDGSWKSIENLSRDIRTYHLVGETEMSSLLCFLRGFSGVAEIPLNRCEG